MIKSLLTAFILTLSTIAAAYQYHECTVAFDRVEAERQETDRLLAQYRQELDALHFAIYGTHQ